MPDADTSPSVDLPRSRRRTFAAALTTRTLAASAAIAASWAAFDAASAQVTGDAVQNCADCAPARQPGNTRRLLQVGISISSIDDIGRVSGTGPAGRGFSIVNASGVDLAALGGEEAFLELFDYVVARAGASLDRSVGLRFAPRVARDCPIRGVAQWSPIAPRIDVYLASSDRKEALGILAHELGHIVQALGFESGGMTADAGFDQGYATWMAGRYWTDMLGFGSFAEAVASYRAAGSYIPLGSFPEDAFRSDDDARLVAEDAGPADSRAVEGSCLVKRDVWFTSWAAFIDDLVERFGAERLRALLGPTEVTLSSTNEQGQPTTEPSVQLEFVTVYGATLEKLEADWLQAIDRRNAESASAVIPAAQ